MRRPEIVALDAVPEAAVIELLRVSLGAESLRTAEFWRWKHRDNPFGPSPGRVAVDDSGRPVAVRVFLRWELEAGGRILRAVRAVDTATHPDWQRRGLFRLLTTDLADRLAAEGTDLIFNTPNARSLRGYLSMGWREIGKVPLRVKVRRPLAAAWRRIVGGEDGPLVPTGLPDASEILAGWNLDGLLAPSDPGDGRIRTRRSGEYLRWRYGRMPAFRYGALAREHAGARALCIFRLRLRAGARELSISEILSNGADGAERLAAELCREAAEATRCDYALAGFAPATFEERCLGRAGFLPFRVPGPILAARPLRQGIDPDPALVSSWRLAVGDVELF